MAQRTNGYAIASLVLGIVTLCGVGSVLAIIFGRKARREIRASNGLQTGDGLALAGMIIGTITLILVLVYVALLVLVLLGGEASMKFSTIDS